jgi:anti-sigma factor RsiW
MSLNAKHGGVSGWVARDTLRPPPGGLVALAQEATASYNVYAPDRIRPVEVRASDSAQLVQWVSERLHRPVKVPDLTDSGYQLMGGSEASPGRTTASAIVWSGTRLRNP